MGKSPKREVAAGSYGTRKDWAGLESLEGRLLLSGNVTAVLKGPTLVITGDTQNNSIVVEQTAGGFVLSGAADTTVNSSSDPVPINGVVKNLRFSMVKGGDDTVIVSGDCRLSGKLTYRGGKGKDVFDCSAGSVQAVAASGQVVFTAVPGQAADGTFVFTPVAGQAATGQFVLDLTAVGSAASADIILEANPVDGDAFTVNDGVNSPVTFTFRDTPAGPTDVPIGGDAATTAGNIVNTLNAAGLALTAAVTDVATVTLTADTIALRSNWDVASDSVNITTQVSPGTDPNVSDGVTVAVNDGVNGQVFFTFRDAPVDPTDVQIGATAADSMSNLASVLNGSGLALTATAGGTSVTLTANTIGFLGNWALGACCGGFSVQNVSLGVDALSNIADGVTVSVNDGVNGQVFFTFRDTPVNPTDVQIGATAVDSMSNLASVLNGSGLALTAAASDTSVTLTAGTAGFLGNWALGACCGGMSVQNVSQGIDALANVADGYAVSVDDGVNGPVTFTFRDIPLDPTDVQVGATAADSMSNLASVLNGAGLALTAAAGDASVTLTASTAGLRPDWSLIAAGAGLAVQNVSQGAAGGTLPSCNCVGDIDIGTGDGDNTVLLGSQDGSAGQVSCGSKLKITTGKGDDTVQVSNASVAGATMISVGKGSNVVDLLNDAYIPTLSNKPQNLILKAGSGDDSATVTGCDMSGYAAFSTGSGVDAVQVHLSTFKKGVRAKKGLVQYV